MAIDTDEQSLLDGLIDAIGSIPNSHAMIAEREISLAGRWRIDAIVHASIAGQAIELIVEVKQNAFPRDVRETIYQLRTYLSHYDSSAGEVIPFFAARAISPGARDILRSEGIGFYDLGGSLYMPASHAFVHIDRPAPRRSKKVFDAIFQGQKAQALLCIYEHRRDWLSVKAIAEEAEVSAATASETLSEMERREWVVAEGAGPAKRRRLTRPAQMIDAWTSYIVQQKPAALKRFYVPCTDVNDLMRKLHLACDAADVAYAITGEAAAQVYAPYLSTISQVRCRIQPGPRRADALARLGARSVAEGWNLGLVDTGARGDLTVGSEIEGVRFAPPLQVYLDLQQGSGRSKEMAAHLRSERLAT
ncbi:MarR family transcriptional regulator [Sphingomonas sp. GM_Shp_2]|uniref:MarR family transcriptional regulator n=1 Tax=Sphingomonas sp. GM_Shp_2 TaxID=2937380 RepID=UPI00226AEE98|nr:MarR family transcriptional regulator [Sphingomonas sp. GM_Shp_2]